MLWFPPARHPGLWSWQHIDFGTCPGTFPLTAGLSLTHLEPLVFREAWFWVPGDPLTPTQGWRSGSGKGRIVL